MSNSGLRGRTDKSCQFELNALVSSQGELKLIEALLFLKRTEMKIVFPMYKTILKQMKEYSEAYHLVSLFFQAV